MKQDPILVKFRATEHFVDIRTVTKERRSPHSLSLPRYEFVDLESQDSITVNDGYSFANIRLSKDRSLIRFDFTWLESNIYHIETFFRLLLLVHRRQIRSFGHLGNMAA